MAPGRGRGGDGSPAAPGRARPTPSALPRRARARRRPRARGSRCSAAWAGRTPRGRRGGRGARRRRAPAQAGPGRRGHPADGPNPAPVVLRLRADHRVDHGRAGHRLGAHARAAGITARSWGTRPRAGGSRSTCSTRPRSREGRSSRTGACRTSSACCPSWVCSRGPALPACRCGHPRDPAVEPVVRLGASRGPQAVACPGRPRRGSESRSRAAVEGA